MDVAKANIQAQKSKIARLERLQSYERVIAPFEGVITRRNIDVGSLVAADATSGLRCSPSRTTTLCVFRCMFRRTWRSS